MVLEPAGRRQRSDSVAGRVGDRARDRVLGGVLERADHPQRLGFRDAVGGNDRVQAHPSRGHGPRLVEDDRVYPPRRLEHLGSLDQQPELGATAGADEQRRRRREAERARAGDDQDGNRGGERVRGVDVGREPEAERRRGKRDHDRDEDPRDPVGEALDVGLAGLRLGDQARDLCERGIAADPSRADDEAPAGVDRRSRDRVARCDLDRHRLAGEQ